MTEERMSIERFNYWRFDRTAAMTLVDLCHGGALYYYRSPYSCTVWMFVCDYAMLISYGFKGFTPDGVRDEVRRLLDALRSGKLEDGSYPEFAVLFEPNKDMAQIAHFWLGDWFGLFREGRDLPPDWNQLPPGWQELDRARIERLIDERVKMAQASSLRDEIYPIGRALGEMKMYARAEVVYRRLLELERRAGDTAREASTTQSLGALAAHQQRYEEAVELLGEAVRMWTTIGGADDARVASAQETLNRVLQRQSGRF